MFPGIAAMFANPATWVALGALGVGTLAQYQQREAIADRQRALTQREMMRQNQLDSERAAAMRDTLAKMERPAQEQKRNEIAEQLEQYLMPADSVSAEYATTNAAAPTEIKEREARALAESLNKAKDYARGLAQMSSWGNLNFNIGRDLSRLGEHVGRINTTARRSSEILPIELQGAMSAGRGWGLLSDIANGVGSIAGMYAMMNPVQGGAALGSGLQLKEVSGLTPGFAGGQGLKMSTQPALGLRMSF